MKNNFLKRILKAIRSPSTAIANQCSRYLDFYNDFSYDFYTNGEYDFLKKLSLLDIKTVFDVGSNVGDWATIAGKLFPSAKIHCFELSKTTFTTLKENLNGICTVCVWGGEREKEQFLLNNFGLADTNGKIKYKDYGRNFGGNTILLDADYHDSRFSYTLEEGMLHTGEYYTAKNDISFIDLLKIDVEGAEHKVLKGFLEMLGKQKIRAIQFEYGYTHGDAKFLMRDFYKLFNSCGYIVGKIRKGRIIFSPWTYKHNDFKSGPNYIAIRETDTELYSLLS